MEPIRIEKYLSESGIASRRESQALIKAGQVLINGKKVKETGIKIDPKKDKVELSVSAKKEMTQKMTMLVYKPRGVISAKDGDNGEKTVFDTFPHFKGLNTVGRLDKESEGLLLLSNDGLITKTVTGKDKDIEKEYEVEVREDVLPWMIEKFETGIKIEGGYVTKPAKAKKVNKNTFRITLTEGKKHQVRRMANAVQLTIKSLKRIRIGDLKIGNMKPGHFKKLTEEQVSKLR